MRWAKRELTPGSAAARDLADHLRERARALGCDAVGIADPAARPDPQRLRHWLAGGLHAGMAYLERRVAMRCDPALLLPGVRSIVCIAVSYYVARPAGGEPGGLPAEVPRIARYAWGHDYHRLLREKLHALLAEARRIVPDVRGRVAVDTAPILERHWAAQAGLGWVGRNGCLIIPGLGSWVFLGELLLDLPLPVGRPRPTRCGRCRRCLDRCPTGALIAPQLLDARRCIAYWTIEHRGPFPESGVPPIAPWLFGCDVCQEVCPWNRQARETSEPALREVGAWCDWDLAQWRRLDERGFAHELGATALARAGFEGLRRNLRELESDAARRRGRPTGRPGTGGGGEG
jgi:epoxyqueuosine reductase